MPQKRSRLALEFQAFATRASYWVGTKWAFGTAALIIIGWGISGPYFHYSDTWQLVVNTATTIVTFLMVFLIQNTQNRDGKALHLKLDEIIRSIREAHNEMISIEKLPEDQLEILAAAFEGLAQKQNARRARQSLSDSGLRHHSESEPRP